MFRNNHTNETSSPGVTLRDLGVLFWLRTRIHSVCYDVLISETSMWLEKPRAMVL